MEQDSQEKRLPSMDTPIDTALHGRAKATIENTNLLYHGSSITSNTRGNLEDEAPVALAASTAAPVLADSRTRSSGLVFELPPKNFGEQQSDNPREPQKAVFVDPAAMKEKVRQNLTKRRHSVTDYYKSIGVFQAIARHQKFENMTLLIIAFNAIWIAVDTDHNDADVLLDAHWLFQLAENLFCSYFSFEWICRFCAFKKKRNCMKDAWFVFDSMLVLTMVLETWAMTMLMVVSGGGGGGGMGNASILRIARLLRLSRMARMARLLRAMPELMVLIKGMLAATRSVFFTLCLLILIMYIFAIAFTQLCAGTRSGEAYFPSVPNSMYNLLVHGALLDDVSTTTTSLGRDSIVFAGIFFVFSLLAALTVMNMLIGVLCEVVSAVASTEKEEMLVTYVNEKLRQVLSILDKDGDLQISKREFVEILENVDAARALQEVGVDVVGLIDFADFIFTDDNPDEEGHEIEKELSFGDFMEVVLQLRGSNNSTVKDVVDLRKFIRRMFMQQNNLIQHTQRQLSQLSNAVAAGSVASSNRTSLLTEMKLGRASTYFMDNNHNNQDNTHLETTKEVTKDVHVKSEHNVATGEAKTTTIMTAAPQNAANEELKSLVKHEDKLRRPTARTMHHFNATVEEGALQTCPMHPLETPSAELLHHRLLGHVYGNGDGSMSYSAHTVPKAHDVVALQGQWPSVEGGVVRSKDDKNLLKSSLPSHLERPLRANDKQEEALALDEWAWNSDAFGAIAEVDRAAGDRLQGQIAKLGTVLSAGIMEFHKLQDWLVQEPARGTTSAGFGNHIRHDLIELNPMHRNDGPAQQEVIAAPLAASALNHKTNSSTAPSSTPRGGRAQPEL